MQCRQRWFLPNVSKAVGETSCHHLLIIINLVISPNLVADIAGGT